MSIRLYAITDRNGRPTSPFVWRTRYALAHKGLHVETVPIGYTDVPKILGGKYKTVPIIEDRGKIVCDSWAIADYLDETYKTENPLFTSPKEKALTQFFDQWCFTTVLVPMLVFYTMDLYRDLRDEDRDYYVESRKKLFRVSALEDYVAGREEKLPEFRKSLRPVRAVLKNAPFLSGESAGYADYILLGFFMMAGAVSTLPPLEKDDILNEWLARCFALHGGVGQVEMNPLAA